MVTKDVRAERLKSKLASALERIREGVPENEELRERKEVRLNTKNACMEADVSRTLVSGKNCEYPSVRDWLLEEIHSCSGTVLELRTQVRDLKDKISELEDTLVKSDSFNAELIARAHRALRGLSPQGGSAKKSTKAERAAALVLIGRDSD
jgi:chromosome segregation ATPase